MNEKQIKELYRKDLTLKMFDQEKTVLKEKISSLTERAVNSEE